MIGVCDVKIDLWTKTLKIFGISCFRFHAQFFQQFQNYSISLMLNHLHDVGS